MKNIDNLRKKIDLIDDKILDLLKNRSKLANNIGNIKQKSNTENYLFRPERQIEILRRLYLNKDKLFKEEDIFRFWKEIFFHQTKLQGKLNFFIPKKINKIKKKVIFDFFGSDIHLNTFDNWEQAFLSTRKKNNALLILPFPGTTKLKNWWLNNKFKDLFIIASIPIIKKFNNLPDLVVVSKQKPILKGLNAYIYISQSLENEIDLFRIVKINNFILYISKKILKNKTFKFIGSYSILEIK